MWWLIQIYNHKNSGLSFHLASALASGRDVEILPTCPSPCVTINSSKKALKTDTFVSKIASPLVEELGRKSDLKNKNFILIKLEKV